MTISKEDIIRLVQEWFGECVDAPEVARLYAMLISEADKQMELMLEELKGE